MVLRIASSDGPDARGLAHGELGGVGVDGATAQGRARIADAQNPADPSPGPRQDVVVSTSSLRLPGTGRDSIGMPQAKIGGMAAL